MLWNISLLNLIKNTLILTMLVFLSGLSPAFSAPDELTIVQLSNQKGIQQNLQVNMQDKDIWKLWRKNETLTVSYRPADNNNNNKLIEIKATATVNSTLSGFLLFLQDYANIPNWLDNASRATLLQQISARENIFITYFDAFWPVKPREMVIHSRYWQNPDLSIELSVNDANEEIAKTTKAIRIKVVKAHWRITPLSAKQIKIEHIISADPRGNIPLWLANKLSLRSMWSSIKALGVQLPKSSWQKKYIPGIKEFNVMTSGKKTTN